MEDFPTKDWEQSESSANWQSTTQYSGHFW